MEYLLEVFIFFTDYIYNYSPIDLAFLKPSFGVFYWAINKYEKRCFFYFDIQNLYRTALTSFDIPYPNFDSIKLVHLISKRKSLNVKKIRIYTGIPPKKNRSTLESILEE